MYDYTIKIKLGDTVKSASYQDLIRAMGIENEESHGRPFSDGGTPQAQTVAVLLKDVMRADSVTVYFQGQVILGA